MQITEADRISYEFYGVKPAKQSYTDSTMKFKTEGQYNLKTLDNVVNSTFRKFAYNRDFQRLVRENPEILEVMKKIKKFYHNNIVSYDFPVSLLEKEHMGEFEAILDSRLNANDFCERLRELQRNLYENKQTSISDNLRYSFIFNEKEKRRRDELEIYRQLKKETREKQQEVRQPVPKTKITITSSRNPFYQRVLNYIRATPDLSLCMKNPESAEYIPYIKNIVGDNSDINEKLKTLFMNDSSRVYRAFKIRLKDKISMSNSIVQRIIERQAQRAGKESGKFELIDINPSTWNWLSSYYSIETPIKNLVLNLRKNYANSLVNLVEKAYEELLRTPGIQN
jgi:hypothetical protein